MRPLEDFEKALLVLHISSGCDLRKIKMLRGGNMQEKLLAYLCFDGDMERANKALHDCMDRGFADRAHYSRS